MADDVLAEAEALVEQTSASIQQAHDGHDDALAAHFERRLDADLAGLRRALDGLARHWQPPGRWCTCGQWRWICPDAARYSAERDARLASIRDIATLYPKGP